MTDDDGTSITASGCITTLAGDASMTCDTNFATSSTATDDDPTSAPTTSSSSSTCGHVPSLCLSKEVSWAVSTGITDSPQYYPSFKSMTGVELASATDEDMILYWFCVDANPNNNCGGLQIPCGRTCGTWTDETTDDDTDGNSDTGYSGSAQLTYYNSYAECCPSNPNYDSTASTDECDNYSACDYSGSFWAIGQKSFEFVQSNNLVAFYDANDPNGDNFLSKYGEKKITITKGDITCVATIVDSCKDSDCNGCCTTNAYANGGSGYLVDVEYYTAQRCFGVANTYGSVDFVIGDVVTEAPTTETSAPTIDDSASTPAPIASIDNGETVTITNKDGINEWWYAVIINGGNDANIASVEMKASNMNEWETGAKDWNYWFFNDDAYRPYSPPFSFRITNIDGDVITSSNVISSFNEADSGEMRASFNDDDDVENDEGGDGSLGWPEWFGIIVCALLIPAIIVAIVCVVKAMRSKTTVEFDDDVDEPQKQAITTAAEEEIEIEVSLVK